MSDVERGDGGTSSGTSEQLESQQELASHQNGQTESGSVGDRSRGKRRRAVEHGQEERFAVVVENGHHPVPSPQMEVAPENFATGIEAAVLLQQQQQQQQQHQQQQNMANHASNLLLQHQAGAILGLTGGANGLFNPANLMLANQIQAGAAQAQQNGGSNNSGDQQQQLAAFLQQQLWGAGIATSSQPMLAQYLGLAMQQNAANNSVAATTNSSHPNFIAPQDFQGLLNQSSLFAAQNAGYVSGSSGVPSAGTASINGNSSVGSTNHQQHAASNVQDFFNNARSFGQPAAQVRGDQDAGSESLTGRPSIALYITCDDDSLSEYQCLVRKQIELFEADREDAESNAQGRNRPITMGQVGIRCRHCTMLPPKHRARGAIYYPAKLNGVYQAAQNLASAHLGEHCQHVPANVRNDLATLRERKSSAGGGKKYWADGVRVLGVLEDEFGLRFIRR